MAATLLAVIVALAIGHLAPDVATGVRQTGWFGSWLRWLNAQFPEGSVWRSRFGIALALVVPVLVVGLFQLALDQPLWGFVGLLFDVAVLFYCWGPRDLDLDVAGVIDAPDAAARRRALAALNPREAAVPMDGSTLVDLVFRNARQRWFGVLFWFCLLGPVGALLYRLSDLAAEQESATLPADTLQGARTWQMLLNWPVTQLMTLTLALVGNFDSVASAWREEDAFALRTRVLSFAAKASVRSEIAEEAGDYTESGIPVSTAIAEVFGELPELRDAMNLAWRILILWLAVLALFVLAGWVS